MASKNFSIKLNRKEVDEYFKSERIQNDLHSKASATRTRKRSQKKKDQLLSNATNDGASTSRNIIKFTADLASIQNDETKSESPASRTRSRMAGKLVEWCELTSSRITKKVSKRIESVPKFDGIQPPTDVTSTHQKFDAPNNKNKSKSSKKSDETENQNNLQFEPPAIKARSQKKKVQFLNNATNGTESTSRNTGKSTVDLASTQNDDSKSEPPAMSTRGRIAVNNKTNEVAITQKKRNRPNKIDDPNAKPPKRFKTKSTNDITSTELQSTESTVQIVQRTKSKKTSRQIILSNLKSNALMPPLHEHQLLWGYVRGFSFWPGVLENILPNGKYRIHFFGDYSRADLTRRCILDYFEGFSQFECNFGNIKLKKAVEEAKYFLFGDNNKNECYVCNILVQKTIYNMKYKVAKTIS